MIGGNQMLMGLKTQAKEEGARPSIRLHLIIGLAVVAILAGGLGGWASTAEISGALIARFWPEPDSSSQATTDLTERLGALEPRFSAVTSANEPDIAALKTRVAQLEKQITGGRA